MKASLSLLALTFFVSADQTSAERDARMEWWREAKFGMFIHWGLYAIPARGEWVMNQKKIPVAEYATLLATGKTLTFKSADGKLIIDVPANAPDPTDTVIALVIEENN